MALETVAHSHAGVANYAMGYPTPAPPNDDMDTILNFNPPETELLEQVYAENSYVRNLLIIA